MTEDELRILQLDSLTMSWAVSAADMPCDGITFPVNATPEDFLTINFVPFKSIIVKPAGKSKAVAISEKAIARAKTAIITTLFIKIPLNNQKKLETVNDQTQA